MSRAIPKTIFSKRTSLLRHLLLGNVSIKKMYYKRQEKQFSKKKKRINTFKAYVYVASHPSRDQRNRLLGLMSHRWPICSTFEFGSCTELITRAVFHSIISKTPSPPVVLNRHGFLRFLRFIFIIIVTETRYLTDVRKSP